MKEASMGERIRLLLEQKLALFRRYVSATRHMKERLKGMDMAGLRTCLSDREECIHRIQKIDASMEQHKAGVNKNRHHLLNHIRETMDHYLKEAKGMMESIDAMDRELMVMVQEESMGLKKEILMMRHVGHAARGYKRAERNYPRFLDARK